MPDVQQKRVIDDVEPWIEVLWNAKGTDLLLTAGAPPMIRVDGAMHPIEGQPVLSSAQVRRIVLSVVGDDLIPRYEEYREVDFAFDWMGRARLRCNAFHQRDTCSLALRMIPYVIPGLHELGVPPGLQRLVNLPQGLIIVTGPTGSGKSTTLAAMLDYINRHRPCHIITIEDPIEYVHGNHRSAVSQREVGTDALSFERALRAALREDPDVVLVGEMRDLESIATALTIAETGHLVFATLHTNDSGQALDRIVDIFPSDRRDQIEVQLSASLEGVLYQRLIPRIGGGLVAAYELLIANHAVRNLVREGKTRQLRNVIATSQGEGMQTLEQSLSALVANGSVEYEAALHVSLYPKEVEKPPPGMTIVRDKPRLEDRPTSTTPDGWIAEPDAPRVASL